MKTQLFISTLSQSDIIQIVITVALMPLIAYGAIRFMTGTCKPRLKRKHKKRLRSSVIKLLNDMDSGIIDCQVLQETAVKYINLTPTAFRGIRSKKHRHFLIGMRKILRQKEQKLRLSSDKDDIILEDTKNKIRDLVKKEFEE